jgi:hypothetical protein
MTDPIPAGAKVGARPRPVPPTPPLPPVTIRPAGPGHVLVRGIGRRTLDAAGVTDRSWDPIRVGWLLPEAAAEAVVAWCRSHGRAAERTEEVQRDH